MNCQFLKRVFISFMIDGYFYFQKLKNHHWQYRMWNFETNINNTNNKNRKIFNINFELLISLIIICFFLSFISLENNVFINLTIILFIILYYKFQQYVHNYNCFSLHYIIIYVLLIILIFNIFEFGKLEKFLIFLLLSFYYNQDVIIMKEKHFIEKYFLFEKAIANAKNITTTNAIANNNNDNNISSDIFLLDTDDC